MASLDILPVLCTTFHYPTSPARQDSEAVIEKYKSGFESPGDVPFDDLSTMRQNGSDGGSGGDSNSLPGHNSSNHSTPGQGGNPAHRSDTVKGTISAARFKKRANLFTGIFGSNKVRVVGL